MPVEMRMLLRTVGAVRTGVAGFLATLVPFMPIESLSPTISLVATGTRVQPYSKCP